MENHQDMVPDKDAAGEDAVGENAEAEAGAGAGAPEAALTMQSPSPTVRPSLSKAELASLPEAERCVQIKQFVDYATRQLVFRLALADTTDGRGRRLRLAEETMKTGEIVGGGSGHADKHGNGGAGGDGEGTSDPGQYGEGPPGSEGASESGKMLVPLTAEDSSGPVVAELLATIDAPARHTTEDFLSLLDEARDEWGREDEFKWWRIFCIEYTMRPTVQRLVIFDRGRPFAGSAERRRAAMRQYAQVLSMERWMSIRFMRDVRVFLHSQAGVAPQDEAALRGLGFTCLVAAHEAFALMDQETVVVDFGSLLPVRRAAFEITSPAAIICRELPEAPDVDAGEFAVRDPEVNGGEVLVVAGPSMLDPLTKPSWDWLKSEYREVRVRHRLHFGKGCGMDDQIVAYVRKVVFRRPGLGYWWWPLGPQAASAEKYSETFSAL